MAYFYIFYEKYYSLVVKASHSVFVINKSGTVSITRERDAITSDMIGTTRDIKKREVTISGNRDFEVIDTGGIDDSTEMFATVNNELLDKMLQY
jgi:predicted GTPase